eukprot:167892_1
MFHSIILVSMLISLVFGGMAKKCKKGQCLEPVTGICKKPVECIVDPCFINNGGCYGKKLKQCTANKCGGCYAVCGPCVAGTVNCFVDPCSNNNGGCISDTQCYSNYCGGCKAVCGECMNGIANCLVDPCANNGGCAQGKTCVANYCGGCHAVCVD